MTRIIAGFAGSRTIAVPPSGTRPTSDRVREAIFSALDTRVEWADSAVLDLYSGSGALGLEAASRGATQVTLVEKNPGAHRVCSSNAALIRAAAPASAVCRINAVRSSADQFLAASAGPWDVVFLDPPYDLPNAELLTTLTALRPQLSAGATVLVERDTRSGAPLTPATLPILRSKRYGDTVLHWMTPTE